MLTVNDLTGEGGGEALEEEGQGPLRLEGKAEAVGVKGVRTTVGGEGDCDGEVSHSAGEVVGGTPTTEGRPMGDGPCDEAGEVLRDEVAVEGERGGRRNARDLTAEVQLATLTREVNELRVDGGGTEGTSNGRRGACGVVITTTATTADGVVGGRHQEEGGVRSVAKQLSGTPAVMETK